MNYIVQSGEVSSGVSLFWDDMIVRNGGTAIETNVDNCGLMKVSSGGLATNTTVNVRGSMFVSCGGSVTDTTVNSGGSMYVSSGGMATDTTVNGSYGYMHISSGGTANSTTVNSSGWMLISSGGTANSTTVNSNGRMLISSGGTALRIKENGGYVRVDDGAEVSFVANAFSGLVLSRESATVHSGTTATDTTVNYGGSMYVSPGGTALRIKENGGYVDVKDGANVTFVANAFSGLVLSSYQSATVHSGTTATGTTVSSGGCLLVSSGGMATDTTVNSRGHMYISSGGMATGTMVNSSGNMSVSSGGTATNTTVGYYGSMHVSSGGMATDTTVNSRGHMYISSGGTATGIVAKDCTRLGITVASNTYIQGSYNGSAFKMKDAFISGYTVVNDGSMSIVSGGTATNTTVDYTGSMFVSNGGVANRTTVNLHGHLTVSNGGTANNTTVNHGSMHVSSVGKATGTMVHSSGSLEVSSGGMATETTVNFHGRLGVLAGGTANSTTVNSCGRMNVSSGGTALKIRENGGYVDVADGANVTFVANAFSGSVLSGGQSATAHSGTTATAAMLTGGDLYIFSGGKASGTTMNSHGYMYVSSGGTATGTTVDSSARIYVYNGGTATRTTVNTGAAMYISSGGTAVSAAVNGSVFVAGTLSRADISAGAYLSASYTKLSNVTILRGGVCSLANDDIQNLVVASRGDVTVRDCVISGAVIHSSGSLDMSRRSDKMVITDATVNSNGKLFVRSGCSAEKVTLNSNGTLVLANGGIARNVQGKIDGVFTMLGEAVSTHMSGGSMYVGDSAFRNYDGTGGWPTSNVYNEDIHASGTKLTNAWMHVYYGASATDTTITSNSWMHVYYGGSGISNEIHSSGYLTVQDSGTVKDTVVHSGGFMRLSGGAVLKGETTLGGSMTVFSAGTSATEDVIRAYGATINYQLSERKTSDKYMISNLGMIMGANYTVTIGYNQKAGTYALADGASDFSGKITIKCANGDTIGKVSANGATLNNRYGKFSLRKSNGKLSIAVQSNIVEKTAPTITVSGNPTKWTKSSVKLTAAFKDDLSGIKSQQYSTDKKTWKTYSAALTVTKNATYYFRATDNAGNVSAVKTVKVTKIDKTKPTVSVKASTTAWTKSNVSLTATFTDKESGIKSKQYSLNNKDWKTYSKAVTISKNQTVYFRATDNAGNVSAVKSVKVSKIDKVAPTVSVSGNPTKWTKSSVKLTAAFKDDLSGVKTKQYSTDKKTWKTYSKAISVTKNATYYFRATDNAGNVSAIKSVKVSKIDKVAPTVSVSGNPTKWTKSSVKLTAAFKDDLSGIKTKQYSTDNKTWKTYSSALTVTKNATYYFRATDNAGNVSAVKTVKVSKIDKTKPTVSVKASTTAWTKSNVSLTATFTDKESGIKSKQYSLNNKDWKTYSKAVTVSKNQTVYFRATDNAGNVTTGIYEVKNIDKTNPAISVSGNPKTWVKSAELTATFTDKESGIKSQQYSTDNKTWKSYSSPLTVTKNATYYFKATDNAGNTTTKSVKVTKVGNGDNSNDTWQKATAITENSVSGWVGIGDLADYYKFATTKKAQLKFDLDTATSKAVKDGKLNVVCLDANGKNVSLVWDGADFATKSKVAAGSYILGVTDPVESQKGINYKIAIGK